MEGGNKTSLKRLDNYITFMEEDLKTINLDEEKFDEKIYLFMLYATFFKDRSAKIRIKNFFLKGTTGEDEIKDKVFSSNDNKDDYSIKKINDNKYEIKAGKESKIIEKNIIV